MLRRLHEHYPHPSAEATLANAHLVIARDHGVESWPKFVKMIETARGRLSSRTVWRMAEEAVVAGDVATLEQLLRDYADVFRNERFHRHTRQGRARGVLHDSGDALGKHHGRSSRGGFPTRTSQGVPSVSATSQCSSWSDWYRAPFVSTRSTTAADSGRQGASFTQTLEAVRIRVHVGKARPPLHTVWCARSPDAPDASLTRRSLPADHPRCALAHPRCMGPFGRITGLR